MVWHLPGSGIELVSTSMVTLVPIPMLVPLKLTMEFAPHFLGESTQSVKLCYSSGIDRLTGCIQCLSLLRGSGLDTHPEKNLGKNYMSIEC